RPAARGPLLRSSHPSTQRSTGGSRRNAEPVQQRVAARLCAVRDAELAIDLREVELDGLLGQPELTADLRVGAALRYETEDLVLARGQRGFGRGRHERVQAR